MHEQDDIFWMRHALSLAQQAKAQDEVPVGAVLIKDNQILGEGFNCSIQKHDPTSHAEIQAIRQASQNIQNYRLVNTTLYVTLEPCAMCAGAIIHSRIKRIVFGAPDPRTGAAGSVLNVLQNALLNHQVDITQGVLVQECAQILIEFFKLKRNKRLKPVLSE